MVKVTNDAATSTLATYTYGAGNRRLVTTDAAQTRTYYGWAGGTVLAEYTESAASPSQWYWSKSYIQLGGSLLATIQPNGAGESVEYHHPDRLGTRLTTNNLNTSHYEQASLPFGTALDAESTGATNRRFTSYDRSPSTGLDYALNRTYDSAQGRFTQVDPIEMDAVDLGDPQSLNLYTYCGNDPVNHTDPEGLFFKKLFKGIWKILKSKWFAIAVTIALAVITVGAGAGWWSLTTKITKWIDVGFKLANGTTYLAVPATVTSTLGWVAAGLGTALAIPGLTSLQGILGSVASYGAGVALGGIGGGAGDGGTPGWNPDANDFMQRRGGQRSPLRRGQRGYRGPGSWYYGTRRSPRPRTPAAGPPLSFRGLNQNRPLRELTHNEIYDAFRDTQFTPSSHAVMRLRDQRTYDLGIRTLNDYANSLNGGIRSGNFQIQPTGTLLINHGRFQSVINPSNGRIVTIKPN